MSALRSVASYTRELRPALSKGAFAPARSRLAWLPCHLGIIGVATYVIASGRVPWVVAPVLSIVIGGSFAGLTFLAHEALHGGVVRGKRLRTWVGWVSFLPFVISPRLWVAWHNRVHHGHTGEPDVDPDCYPTLAQYEGSRIVRVMTDHLALGYRHRVGAFSVLVGFSVQSAHMLVVGRRMGLSPSEHARAGAETLGGVAVWVFVLWLIGPLAFIFVFVLPLIVANTLVMTFILTNHSLSAHTEVNDPLVNSLSVTTPAWYEWLTLGFGMHVEHHLFPSMSSRHTPEVRTLLRSMWPGEYRSMGFGHALLALMRSGRVYETPTSLVDPRTGRVCQTLGPAPP